MNNIKETIRKEILTKLRVQAKSEASKKSFKIRKQLFETPEFKNAKFVMLYASRPEEVKTDDIIDGALETGKRVALPRCTREKVLELKEITDRNRDLEKGTYDIPEPREDIRDAHIDEIDLVIVPGVAFDKKNIRLGRGKGYYDRFLEKLPPDKVIIGLAFDFQIVDNLPKDSHDIPVSKVITG